MKLSNKLYLMTCLSFVLYLGVAIPSYIGFTKLDPSKSSLMMYLSGLKDSMSADMMHDALRGDVLQAILLSTSGSEAYGSKETTLNDLEDHAKTFRDAIEDARALDLAPNERAALQEVGPVLDSYISSAEEIVSKVFEDPKSAEQAYPGFLKAFGELEDKMEALSDLLEQGAEQSRAESISMASSLRLAMVAISIVGALIIAALSAYTIRTINKSLNKIIGCLTSSFKSLDNSARGIATSGTELSTGAQEQAAAIQEAVSAMAEMSSMIRQTTDHAKSSLSGARTMGSKAEEGGRTMEQMVASMEAIQQANVQLQEMVNIINQISAKTAVINDIVFKTQLLSFNASIEAARAGQHGRGFAVVAEEVGNLAEMSGGAAKEIQALLEDSKKQVARVVDLTQSRVNEGQVVSKQSLAIFSQISHEIREVSSLIDGIHQATREQESGVHQTSTSMTQMDQSGQRIRIMTQKLATAAHGLAGQSRELESVVGELAELVHGRSVREQANHEVHSRIAHTTNIIELSSESEIIENELENFEHVGERLAKKARHMENPAEERSRDRVISTNGRGSFTPMT